MCPSNMEPGPPTWILHSIHEDSFRCEPTSLVIRSGTLGLEPLLLYVDPDALGMELGLTVISWKPV